MILRLLLAGAVLAAIITVVRRAKQKSPVERRKYYFSVTLVVLAGALVLLALTGRVHWIGALIGALLPFIRQGLPLLIRLVPFLQQRKAQAEQGAHEQSSTIPRPPRNMSREQALEILGLKEGADREAIIKAHRSLMQKLHPDRGGNDYLAAQINLAKDVLLGE